MQVQRQSSETGATCEYAGEMFLVFVDGLRFPCYYIRLLHLLMHEGQETMYAIVTTGGKQYKVATDDVLTVEKFEGEAGTKVELPVIFLNDGKKIITDPAKLAKAKVTAEIVDQFKGEKQLVYKFKKRKRYHKLQGHRQQLTKLKITKVQATSRAKKAVAEDAAAPAAE